MGRPLKWQEDAINLSLKVTKEMNEKLELAAYEINLTKSDYARMALRQCLELNDGDSGRVIAALGELNAQGRWLLAEIADALTMTDKYTADDGELEGYIEAKAQKMADGMATAQLLAAYEQWETQSEEKSQERLEQELERMYDEVREKVLQEIEEDAEKGE